MTTKPTLDIKLDWTRLLGFDQASPAQSEPLDVASGSNKLGTKIGVKIGGKPCVGVRRQSGH